MDNRRFKRVKSNFDININIIKNSESKPLDQGKSVNMSACGVLLKYNKPIDIGTNIDVKFYDKNSTDSFESGGRVVRVEMNPDNKSYEIGIEFLNLDEANVAKLNAYLINSEQEEMEDENSYFIEIEIPEELLIKPDRG